VQNSTDPGVRERPFSILRKKGERPSYGRGKRSKGTITPTKKKAGTSSILSRNRRRNFLPLSEGGDHLILSSIPGEGERATLTRKRGREKTAAAVTSHRREPITSNSRRKKKGKAFLYLYRGKGKKRPAVRAERKGEFVDPVCPHENFNQNRRPSSFS